ncbi:MAG: TatD family hydrolase [Faecalicoccus sp.]|nr:TatD family hydrolase [Faecalicoccus sp.]
MYIDSHCHITCDQLYSDLDQILERAEDISGFLIMCTNEEEFKRALPLREKDKRFKIAWGWHPQDVLSVTENDIERLKQNAHLLDCLGEIGLDYYRDSSNKELQKELFIRQIHIANQYNLPISIHMRQATKDTLDLLKEHSNTKIIFHCFSGSRETMKECLKLDSFISFGGPVTFKNARHAPECVIDCPISRLLTETDSPYLAPEPVRGTQNEPSNVRYIAQKISRLKNLDEATFCRQISDNFYSVFKDL